MAPLEIEAAAPAASNANAAASFVSWGFVGVLVNQVIAWLGFPGYMQLLFVALVVLDSIFGTWAAFRTGTYDSKRYRRMFRKFGYYSVLFILAAFLRHASNAWHEQPMLIFSYVIMFALCWTELVSFLKNLNKLAVANGDRLPFLSGVISRVQRGGETFLKIEESPSSKHGSRFMVSGDRVILEGEIDVDIAAELKDSMLNVLKRKKRICIDMGGVHFIDSSGVGAIVACIITANKHMGLKSVDAVCVMDVPPRVKSVLEMHGLDVMIGWGCDEPAVVVLPVGAVVEMVEVAVVEVAPAPAVEVEAPSDRESPTPS